MTSITSLAELRTLLREAVSEASEIRNDADAFDRLAKLIAGVAADVDSVIMSGAQTLPVLVSDVATAAPVWPDVTTGQPAVTAEISAVVDPSQQVAAPVVHPSWCTDCQTDSDGEVYHGSQTRTLDLVDEGGKTTEVWVSVHRIDDADGTQSPTSVTLTLDHDGFDLTPQNAREFGELLIAAANLIEGATK